MQVADHWSSTSQIEHLDQENTSTEWFNAIEFEKSKDLQHKRLSTKQRENDEIRLSTCYACPNAALTADGLTRGTPHPVFLGARTVLGAL